MASFQTYLTFDGNCEEAFNFYKSVFGGEFTHVGRYQDMPKDENFPIPQSDNDRIMHISLPISEGTILYGCDTGGAWASNFTKGNNFSISIDADSREEADQLFASLSEAGSVLMPMKNTFWGSYFGMLTDQFGIQWMLSFDTVKE